MDCPMFMRSEPVFSDPRRRLAVVVEFSPFVSIDYFLRIGSAVKRHDFGIVGQFGSHQKVQWKDGLGMAFE